MKSQKLKSNSRESNNSLSNKDDNPLTRLKKKPLLELLEYIIDLENQNSNMKQKIEVIIKPTTTPKVIIPKIEKPKFKITRDLAKQIAGFKFKKDLLKYIVDNKINIKQFKSEVDFVRYIKKHIIETGWQEVLKLNKRVDKRLKRVMKSLRKC